MKYRYSSALTAVAAAILLSGCATNLTPRSMPANKATSEQTVLDQTRMSEEWNTPAVLTEGKASVVLLTPEQIPDSIRNQRVTLELEPGATVSDLVAVMGRLGHAIILSDQTIAKKEFFLPRYTGTIGGLLSAVTRATDVWFTWHDGTILVSSAERIGISIPQEANFADQLAKGLDSFNIKTKSLSWHAGMASMEVSPSEFRRVRSLLERLTNNAAVVTLQVAIVNVTLKQDARQGINWDKLSIAALSGGNRSTLAAWQNGVNSLTGTNTGAVTTPGTGTGTGTTPGTGSGTTPTPTTPTNLAELAAVTAISLSGGALQGAMFTQRFSFTGLFDYLQTYGTTETKQNMILKTAAGNKVKFKSLTQTPYVEELGVTTTGGNNNNGGVGATMGSTKTAKADDGITLELLPMFDAASESVTIEMELSLKAVVGFNELSAGNQIGKLTQPTTADRSFTDVVRVKPGQTVVLGGLTYDSVSDNKGAPPALAGSKLESQSLKVDRQTMFIVVRPTIQRIGQALRQETGGLDLDFPTGSSPKQPASAERKKGAK